MSHTTWDCKYHVVLIPTCRRKALYAELRRHLGKVFHDLASQKESKIVEGYPMPDHVHMLTSNPPERKFRPEEVAAFASGACAGSPWPLAERMRQKSRQFRSAV